MGKNLGEILNNIMEENASNRVVILTNHMYITGLIHEYHEKCSNCHECLISLKDVKIASLKEVHKCNKEEGCNCEDIPHKKFDWFNINANEIVGFSIINNQ